MLKKYDFVGRWAKTCCSHPVTKDIKKEAETRLKEEMGFGCDLIERFSFIYNEPVGNGLIEHEFDHVFFGKFDGDVKPNPKEVGDWKWISLDELKKDVEENPDKYTPWLRIALDKVIEKTKFR